jgi:hypothetical protein
MPSKNPVHGEGQPERQQAAALLPQSETIDEAA